MSVAIAGRGYRFEGTKRKEEAKMVHFRRLTDARFASHAQQAPMPGHFRAWLAAHAAFIVALAFAAALVFGLLS